MSGGVRKIPIGHSAHKDANSLTWESGSKNGEELQRTFFPTTMIGTTWKTVCRQGGNWPPDEQMNAYTPARTSGLFWLPTGNHITLLPSVFPFNHHSFKQRKDETSRGTSWWIYESEYMGNADVSLNSVLFGVLDGTRNLPGCLSRWSVRTTLS